MTNKIYMHSQMTAVWTICLQQLYRSATVQCHSYRLSRMLQMNMYTRTHWLELLNICLRECHLQDHWTPTSCQNRPQHCKFIIRQLSAEKKSHKNILSINQHTDMFAFTSFTKITEKYCIT